MNTFRYHAGGLILSADRPVRGLFPHLGADAPDVTIHLAARPRWAEFPSDAAAVLRRIEVPDAPANTLEIAWVEGGAGTRFRNGDGSVFYVDAGGSEVWAEWSPALTLEDVTGYIPGPILGYVLRCRGQLAFHSSAILIDGRAAAIIGATAAGKSSLAAAAIIAGETVIADDVLAVRATARGAAAYVGSDHVRLDATSVARVGRAHGAGLDLVGPSWDKYMLPVTTFGARVPDGPIPLGGVFVLEPNDDPQSPRALPMTPFEALGAMLANTSSAPLLLPGARGAELAAVAHVAQFVPVHHLRSMIELGRLHEVVEVIRATMRTPVAHD